MNRPNLGLRGGNSGASLIDRLTRLETAMSQVPSRQVNRPVDVAKTYEATETSHGFTVGKWVSRGQDLPRWRLASNSGITMRDAVGIVTKVLDANTFELAMGPGRVHMPALAYTAWNRYFLSSASGSAVTPSPDYDTDSGAARLTTPVWEQMVALALPDGWIYLMGPTPRDSHNHWIQDLGDVAWNGTAPANGATLIFRTATGLWTPDIPVADLGTRAAVSVIGRAANTAGAAADIAAAADGYVLQRAAGVLAWGLITTASINAGAVTAAKIGTDVVLDTLNDVTIASVAARNFLRYDLASTQWKNYDLGPIEYTDPPASIPVLVLDGGGVTGTAIIAGLGANGSRFLFDGVTGTHNTALDFVLDGRPDLGTEKCARIRRISTTEVAFYDQGTSTITAGTKVLSWLCSTSAASRSFKFLTKLEAQPASGAPVFGVENVGSGVNKLTHDAVSYLEFDSSISDRINALVPIYFGSGYGARITGSASVLSLESPGGAYVTIPHNARIAGAAYTLGFFGNAGTTKATVGNLSAMTTTETADATYNVTEQNMLNNLKVDINLLRIKLDLLVDTLQAYNLVG